MSIKYLLDSDLKVLGDLRVDTVINVSGEIKGVKPLSDLIGKIKVYDGNLSIDTLVLSDKSDFTISVSGSTICRINADKDKLIE